MRFGELVRNSRQKRGLSQTTLAKRLRVTQRYVSQVESGEGDNPTLETIRTFAKALHLKFTELQPLFASSPKTGTSCEDADA